MGRVRLWPRSCVHLLSHRVCISNTKHMRALSRHCVLIKFSCWAKLFFERRRKACTCNNEHRLIKYQPLYAPRDKLRCRVEHSGWLKLEDCLVLIHHYFLVAGKWIEHWGSHSVPQSARAILFEAMGDVPQSVYRPHKVNQTTRAPSEQYIRRHPARISRAA